MNAPIEHFKLIITIVDRGKGAKAVDLYRAHHLHFDFACLGAGTASSKILNYFGLDETAKELVWTLAPRKPDSPPLAGGPPNIGSGYPRKRDFIYHPSVGDQRTDPPCTYQARIRKGGITHGRSKNAPRSTPIN